MPLIENGVPGKRSVSKLYNGAESWSSEAGAYYAPVVKYAIPYLRNVVPKAMNMTSSITQGRVYKKRIVYVTSGCQLLKSHWQFQYRNNQLISSSIWQQSLDWLTRDWNTGLSLVGQGCGWRLWWSHQTSFYWSSDLWVVVRLTLGTCLLNICIAFS